MNDILEIINKNNINGFHLKGGTDKADTHSYDLFYANLFNELKSLSGTLLEIGTYNGGSSLIWHEYFKNFKIVLTDIHNNIADNILSRLENDRHEIIIHDAYKKSNVKKLKVKYSEGFDVIIEDGAHTLNTQQFTIKEYTKLLKKGGILIIEDIQSIEDAEELMKINIRCKSKEIIDLRKNKNRYDDILIVIKK